MINRDETGKLTLPGDLNDLMELDHVIEVVTPGFVRPRADIYAPTVTGEDGPEDAAWQPLKGYSSQGSGIINQAENWHMHDCESIGGQLALDILANPGIYVAVWITWDPDTCDEDADEYGDEPTIEGWCVLFQET